MEKQITFTRIAPGDYEVRVNGELVDRIQREWSDGYGWSWLTSVDAYRTLHDAKHFTERKYLEVRD